MSCYNPDGSGTFNNNTLVPSLYSNGTVYYPYKYGQFLDSLNRGASCGGATYLRPDVGGAILPWLYTIFAILIHLPVVIIRVARWDRVQILSLALAAFTIVLTCQTYKSTSLAPEKILVWMPLTLPLDAGSMLQLAVLIIEDVGYRGLWKGMTSKFRPQSRPRQFQSYEQVGKNNDISLEQIEVVPSRNDEENISNKGRDIDNSTKGLIAISAIILFFAIITLQIIGVVHAAKGRNHTDDLTVAWCSPIFELFTVAVSDGNCNFYPVATNSGKGIGCISLPAERQKDWLQATTIIGSISLVLELVDFLILILVHGKRRWRGIKMKRPWFSMFTGITVLVVLAVVGYENATTLPAGITQSVEVYMNDQGADVLTTCRGGVLPAGLRGAILGWTDGVFSIWNTLYYGPSGS